MQENLSAEDIIKLAISKRDRWIKVTGNHYFDTKFRYEQAVDTLKSRGHTVKLKGATNELMVTNVSYFKIKNAGLGVQHYKLKRRYKL